MGAHTDDVELGCGGTLSRLLEEGVNVHVAVFSTVNPSNPGWPLAAEFMRSMEVLGVSRDNQFIDQFKMRELSTARQQVLDSLYKIKDQINPDLVFLPSQNDIHRDHSTVSKEGIRAFKNVTILAYELPWSNFDFKTQAFFKLKQSHVHKKITCLNAYDSQKQKDYMTPEFTMAASRMRGALINTKYAEVFEMVRLIVGMNND